MAKGEDKMTKFVVEIPDELEELKSASNISWQLAIERALKEEFARLPPPDLFYF